MKKKIKWRSRILDCFVVILLAMTMSGCGGECGNWEYHQVCTENTITEITCDYAVNSLTIQVSDGEGNPVEDLIPNFEGNQTDCDQIEATLSDGNSITLEINIPDDYYLNEGENAQIPDESPFESPDFFVQSYSETNPEGEVVASSSQKTAYSVEQAGRFM